MMKKRPAWLPSILVLIALAAGAWLGIPLGTGQAPAPAGTAVQDAAIAEDGWYDQAREVAAYLHTYGRLPQNYITKAEAEELGWDNRTVTLDQVAPGKSIGGSHFGNYEGQLPSAPGRSWRECDIDASNGVRGVKRLVYSSDGLIYYTDDHYQTFERLY